MVSDSSDVGHAEGVPPAVRFDLNGFTGAGYDKGRSVGIQIAWMLFSTLIFRKWWCPNRLRILILRGFGANIGVNALVRHDIKVHWPWKLTVGDNTWIGEGVWILNLENVAIGSNTCISQDVLLCTGSHNRRVRTFEFDNAPIAIGGGVWVAARATVLRGVTIEDNATIGAAAVVSRDVPQGATVMGPSAQVRSRGEDAVPE